MPYTTDRTAIVDHETVCADPTDPSRLNPVTYVIEMAMLRVGMREITEANVADVWARMYAVQRMEGAFLSETKDGVRVDRPLTFADVRRHIGLTTNGNTVTEASFARSLWKGFKENADYAAHRADGEATG